MVPYSPSQSVLGTLILWLGWLLFNGGSSGGLIGESGYAGRLAIINTILAPSAAGIFTFFTRKMITGQNKDIRLDFQALTNGILAGLVSITAGCGSVDPWAAVVIGIIGSLVYSLSCNLMEKLKIDDPLEAAQVHGFCGIWGCLAIAFFDKTCGLVCVEDCSKDWLTTFGVQLLMVVSIITWVGTITAILVTIAKKMSALRLEKHDEILGGDIHYFGPIELQGSLANYDTKVMIEMATK